MYLYARFLGYKGSITDCDIWAKEEFKKRNFNTILEIEIDSMQVDISKLREAIDLGVVKQDMGAARISMLQKELRAHIKQLADEKHLTDRQGLILAGADRALREILLIFRDDPIEGPLQEASMGVWTKNPSRRIISLKQVSLSTWLETSIYSVYRRTARAAAKHKL